MSTVNGTEPDALGGHRRAGALGHQPAGAVTVYKMHGDISAPDEAVLTKSDYERYDQSRELFSVQLRGDLVNRNFLFLGLSFTDPNVNYILGRVRSLIGENRREHYWITRDEAASATATARDVARQRHRVEDLKTYGIQTHLVEEYSEIRGILSTLKHGVNRRNVLFSGSADDFSPMGEANLANLAHSIGGMIIEKGYNLVCGMGLRVGDAAAMGAIQELYRRGDSHIDERTVLRPFPQASSDSTSRAAIWANYREDLVGRAGCAVYVSGNKFGPDGAAVEAGGVLEEFRLSSLLSAVPVPVGASGWAAAAIAREVRADMQRYYGVNAPEVAPYFEVLQQASSSVAEIVSAIQAILKITTKQ